MVAEVFGPAQVMMINGSSPATKLGAIYSQVEEYCSQLGGNRPIHSILIANNGMAAVKFIRSIRSWAYETFGTERAVLLVAMATPEDLRINAEHIRMADQFVEVPGGTNNNNYANVQLIAEVAERTGVAAVWPGWGHASENPELPDALSARGIAFLGPPAAPMAALGDKIGSTLIAQAAGVPTLAWSGSKVSVPWELCRESIPNRLYQQACVSTSEEAVTTCKAIGYPAMIKASWGGGGKGIRKVHNDDEVRVFFKQVQGEVPGSPIFIMKLASQSRHLEVQLVCDEHGNVAALHSRDCSVQRRHQKIIEEGPITIAPSETIRQLEHGARRLAKCVNYVGAATVEYLYSMDSGEFYFLELNPRLQVEHPVTEWIAEVNLPAAQLAIGMGIPLWKLPEIRRFYGRGGGGHSTWRKTSEEAKQFDFDVAEPVRPKGHVIGVRVTSEDPDDGFKPTTGKVQELSFRSKPNVWAYFSVKSGGGIHEFSDSQFGHVFAFGETRTTAIANMVLGLKELQIRGEILANTDYAVDLLHAMEYKENRIHTGWLDTRIAMRVRTERPVWYLSVVCGALYKAFMLTAARTSEYIGYLEKGQIPPRHISLVDFQIQISIEGSKYTIEVTKQGPGSCKLRLNQSEIGAEGHILRDGGLLGQLDGNSHVVYGEEEAAGTRLLIDGRTCLLQNDHDPSQLIAETPCKLLRFLVPDGSHVDTDSPYAEVEVMKMCMPLLSPASGTISFAMTEGQTMVAGDLIARLNLDDPTAVRKALPFKGTFPIFGSPTPVAAKVHQRCAASVHAARMVLAGYEHDLDQVVQTLLSCLDDPQLPLLQWQECMAVLATRLPKNLKAELDSIFKEFETYFVDKQGRADFPAKLILAVLEAYTSSIPEKDRPSQERLVEPLSKLAVSYVGGREGHACSIVQSLFDEYLAVEEIFSQHLLADVIEALRHQYKKNLLKVVDMVLSHQGLKRKNRLILRLMEALVYPNPAAYREQLIRFAALNHTSFSELAVRSSQLLEQTKLSDLRANIARSLSELDMFITGGAKVVHGKKSAIDERIESLANATVAVEDALVALFDHGDHTLQRRVIETYVRRLYQPYLVKGSIRMQWHRSGLIASWQFYEEFPLTLQESSEPPSEPNTKPKRWGVMVTLSSLHFLAAAVTAALKGTGSALPEIKTKNMQNSAFTESAQDGFGNLLHIALVGINNPMSSLQDSGDEDQAKERVAKLAKILKEESLSSLLQAAGVDVVSCIINRDEGRSPTRHCFRWSPERSYFVEDPLLRHVEPPLSDLLELNKLKNLSAVRYSSSRDRQWHLYSVTEKPSIRRMFLRTVLRQSHTFTLGDPSLIDSGNTNSSTFHSLLESITKALQGALEELELTAHDSSGQADHVHIYLCLIKAQDLAVLQSAEKAFKEVTVEGVMTLLNELAQTIYVRVGARMHRLAVATWETRICLKGTGLGLGVWRVVVDNPTGHACTVQVYREVNDSEGKKPACYYSPLDSCGPLHGVPLSNEHKALSLLDRKRLLARKNSTTYCYDFPLVFETALLQSWRNSSYSSQDFQTDKSLLRVSEIAFSKAEATWETPLETIERPPAVNNVGMVAWSMVICTPEFPGGREILVISNDVTHGVGAFGPKEDAFFKAMTNLACKQGLPLIYLAANSGARIGVAEEVRACFKVGWLSEDNPNQGFQYLYLTPEDYTHVGASVNARKLELATGEVRWVIDDIIGKEDGLGVENLSGSGAIAGAFSKAYSETFTLTFVTGRTVGIGAYLARLGMRCIQRVDQPIILTGFSALNKLLGREVYSSHMQLGGPKIMATNGVVHLTVFDDLEGISAILKWLSYVPAKRGCDLPFTRVTDPPERVVSYNPDTSCDPRAAICGIEASDGKWIGGLFDKGSFVETFEGWARTVVTGRARLGGIPAGVIAVETQTVMQTIPADPGQLDSQERVVPQAGQVWFPDSAAKTAQAILDFNKEGLPLFILANWRGFSGGQRDLFEGVLQAGSTIVEHLRCYEHPVFVYLPRTGELRGGAWVVVDSKINPDHVEMYADKTARAGVLEPEGMIEIKFRTKELIACMHRLDPQITALNERLQSSTTLSGSMESVQQMIVSREKSLLPLYRQIAIRFAELHDTAFRLEAKGIIKKVVNWEDSRQFFHKRLLIRLAEESAVREVKAATGKGLSHIEALNTIRSWYRSMESNNTNSGTLWNDDDPDFLAWMQVKENLEHHLKKLRVEKIAAEISAIVDSEAGLEALPQGFAAALSTLEPSTKSKLLEQLKQILHD